MSNPILAAQEIIRAPLTNYGASEEVRHVDQPVLPILSEHQAEKP
ncbi:hypothetical protein [Azonexus sp.]|nr:hypothetical protein [Azonexus sp.]